jgi:hypothetical protein
LKADCKGCEYYIIEDDAISNFEKVKIEYTGFIDQSRLHNKQIGKQRFQQI